jgi:hypothetical protein
VPNIQSQPPLDALSKRRKRRQVARFDFQDPLRRSYLEHDVQLPMFLEYPGQFDAHALTGGGFGRWRRPLGCLNTLHSSHS